MPSDAALEGPLFHDAAGSGSRCRETEHFLTHAERLTNACTTVEERRLSAALGAIWRTGL